MNTNPIVYVVDDDDAVRDSIRVLLESAGFDVKDYERATFLLADEIPPGSCVIADIRMPQMDGLELQVEIARRNLAISVIIITGHGDVPLAVRAMKAGAVDFIEKPFKEEVLLAAVNKALNTEDRARHDEQSRRTYQSAFANLSKREREVLEQVVVGKTSKVIAYDLGISPRTVEVYRAGMMMKTGAKSLSELVRMALLAGL